MNKVSELKLKRNHHFSVIKLTKIEEKLDIRSRMRPCTATLPLHVLHTCELSSYTAL